MTLEILSLTGPAWVQAPARVGWRVHGVPPGGPLVPELAARAGRAVGNPPDHALIEAFGPLRLCARGGPLLVATGGEARVLGDGEAWDLPAPAPLAVRYVAVRGGLLAPVRAGGRGALPTAPWSGRPLAPGDHLPVGEPAGLPTPRLAAGADDELLAAPVPLLPPPGGLITPALSALLSVRWRVGAVSRTGLSLAGPPLPPLSAGGEGSDVAWPGLVQLPHGGAPVVLGPDAPTTGGYPVIAVVPPAALGSLFSRPPGAEVHFRRG